MIKRTRGEKIFNVCNYIILTLLAVTTIYPFLYTLTISFSTPAEAVKPTLHIIPNFKAVTLDAYRYVFENEELWLAYKNTIAITVIGTVLQLLVTLMFAWGYMQKNYPFKKLIGLFFMGTFFLPVCRIPNFLNIKQLGLMDNFWVYILPSLMTSYNAIIARSFFASLPESLNESARIDGAGEFRIFFQIIVPLSKPVIMTIALWDAVAHWNSWLPTMLYMSDDRYITLQFYIRKITGAAARRFAGSADPEKNQEIVGETLQSASIMAAVIPMLCIYPFIQKYFVKGVTLGAVKG